MLKVIKSNALFALVLLLSIPAYASQPVDTSKAAGFAARLASGFRGFRSTLASTYQKLPSVQDLKAAGNTTLALVKKGADTVGKQTTEFGQKALKRTLPVAQASLAYAGQHSKEIKIASGAAAALGATYAGYRAVKAVLARGKKTEKPGKNASLLKKESTEEAPVEKDVAQLLKEAKAAAAADMQTLNAIYEAGKSLALRSETVSSADAVMLVEFSNAVEQFEALKGSFRYIMHSCEVPEQALELKNQFVALCQEAEETFSNPKDCLKEERCLALFASLTAIVRQLNALS